MRQAQEEVSMHGLNFKVSAQELMVPQLAGSSNTFMGLRNMNNTSFVNVILQVFLQVVRGSANYRFASHLRLGRGEVWHDRGLAM